MLNMLNILKQCKEILLYIVLFLCVWDNDSVKIRKVRLIDRWIILMNDFI